MQPGLVRQAGVVPMRAGQVCLVTSRSGKRWVVPKGNMEPGKPAGEIGLQEAWEEAGLVGLLRQEPLGSYFYEKMGQLCHVIVFQLDVMDQVDHYPEAGLRQRIWLPLPQALQHLDDPGLKDILRAMQMRSAG